MRVLITGAARAIGQATARELQDRGHQVIATARHPEMLDDVPADQRLALDVADPRSVAEALAAALEGGAIDALVNNAGVSGTGPLESYPLDQFADVLQVNTLGPLRVLQPLLPAWRERGSGVVVNLSSVQGQVATPLSGPYSASKFALEAVSEALHLELGHFGIRVVIVEPGYIAPGMKPGLAVTGPEAYAPLRQQWEDAVRTLEGPSGRPGSELVGQAIADALEDPATPLRVRVGADAELVLSARRELDDTAFEKAMTDVLQISW